MTLVLSQTSRLFEMAQTVQPRIVSEPAVDGHVTVVEVRTHFVTAIRMPEAVNSVAVGDPSLFQVEHSEREPNLVFVKSLTAGPAERAGVSEVIDRGQQVIVLFSAVNTTQHAILLVPPQVQLGGKSKRGKLHRSRWTTAEQLVVEDFRLNTRRLAPGERADGVALFERPPYKESNETLLLQVAEAGAVDKPALAPIGFGVNNLREEAADGRGK